MSLKLIGIVLASIIGFAQPAVPAHEPGDLWRMIRGALITAEGDRYFQQIKDAQIPPGPERFSGSVVSQSSPNELIVNVDDPAGDAILWLLIAVKKPIAVGAPVHFEGVVRAYSRNPYKLTIEVLPEEIEGLY